MQPRDLPNLTVGNRPTMGPENDFGYGQRGFRWLVACSLGLLVAAGVTFSLVAQPTENTKIPKAAEVQRMDRSLPQKVQPLPNMAALLPNDRSHSE
jgi:hypothetical protein